MKLLHLNMSKNRLEGDIPCQIGNLHSLQDLDLAKNLLEGEVPQQIGQLLMLETMNISCNQLSGRIPPTFRDMLSLLSVDISYNRLEGSLPNIRAFQGTLFDTERDNKGLWGNITSLKACPLGVNNGASQKRNKKTLILVILISLSCFTLSFLVLFGTFFATSKKLRKIINVPKQDSNGDIFSIWSYDGKLVYENIIEATEDFDAKYCIGTGGSGTVYKADLPSGGIVAVKKLYFTEDGELDNHETFTREIRALTEIRHRNIIKLYGFCFHPRHSLLIYEFLEGGPLEKILRSDENAMYLEWNNRIDIVKGVANGLSYMHHECSPPIVHRHISSKNILLGSEFEAHISDFGTAKILQTCSSNWSSFAGTIGYTAPEIAYAVEVEARQDVYSFGVLTLEVLMGRHPGDLISYLPTSLSSLTETIILLKDVLDPRLPIPRTNHVSEEIVCATRVAFSCLHANPNCRPTMRQVSAELLTRRLQPLQYSFFTITLGQLLDASCLPP